jgi:hypothetical protein
MDVFANPVHDCDIPEQEITHMRRCFMKYAKRMLAVILTMLPMLAVAQLGSDQKLVTNVPFEFTVGNRAVPAGQWTVQRITRNEKMLMIRNLNAKIAVTSSSLPGESKTTPTNSALVFHRYGDSYFLVGIKVQGDQANYRLPESKAEAELLSENRHASVEILVASLK